MTKTAAGQARKAISSQWERQVAWLFEHYVSASVEGKELPAGESLEGWFERSLLKAAKCYELALRTVNMTGNLNL